MTIGLVFVNYFSADLIAERVDAYRDADVWAVVVDNSGDYSGPGIVVGDGTNIGFGSACNLGVESFGHSIKTAILHNPDVSTSVDILAEVANRVSQAGVGLVAPAMDTPDGVVTDGYSYPRLSAEIVVSRSNWSEQRSTGSGAGRSASTARRVGRAAAGALNRTPRFGSAAMLAVDVAAFRRIGGFDDRFILYGEDLDLWHRMKASGAETVFANDVSVFHQRGGGSPASRQTRELLRFAGIQLFAQLHGIGSWKQFRSIHRRALRAVGPGNKIAELLEKTWSAGSDPTSTSRAIRAQFLNGVMADPGSNNGQVPSSSNQGIEVQP